MNKKNTFIKKQKEDIGEPLIVNDNFIRIKSGESIIDYVPLVDIRYPSLIEYESTDENKKQTCWRLSYILVNGNEYTDATPYKK